MDVVVVVVVVPLLSRPIDDRPQMGAPVSPLFTHTHRFLPSLSRWKKTQLFVAVDDRTGRSTNLAAQLRAGKEKEPTDERKKTNKTKHERT